MSKEVGAWLGRTSSATVMPADTANSLPTLWWSIWRYSRNKPNTGRNIFG